MTVPQVLCLPVALLVALIICQGLGSEDEVRLVGDLFEKQGYNPLIRPVRNLSEHVQVNFGLAMVQLISVDEKNQIMKSNVWLRMTWFDYQLEWDPADYGSISTIRILPHKVWKPDIVLFNNADGKYEVSYEPNVVIYSSGHVLWIPPAIYKSSCAIDVEYFPFDQQKCEMKFGSWTFNGKQVKLGWYENKMKVDLTDYVASGTWDIINVPGTHKPYVKEGDVEQIIFTIVIRRKTLFYTVNLIIPCVLISFLSVCVFYLPADAGEKMTMCISILLSLVVFLLLVSKILPPTSIVVPLIAKYLLFTFIMNIFTIFITVIIINWNFRTPRTHRMSKWVRVLFLNCLPRILFMKRPNHSHRWMMSRNNKYRDGAGGGVVGSNSNSTDHSRHYNMNTRSDLLELSDMHHPNCKLNRRSSSDRHGGDMDSAHEQRFHLTPETHKAAESVKFISQHLKNEDEYSEVLEDWRYIAMVIDRLQLYVFLSVTIGGTVGILINAPHIFEYIDQKEVIDSLNGNT